MFAMGTYHVLQIYLGKHVGQRAQMYYRRNKTQSQLIHIDKKPAEILVPFANISALSEMSSAFNALPLNRCRNIELRWGNQMTKTTIRNIDPDALWDAKIYAAQTKQTLGKVFTIALQQLVYEEEGGDE